MKGIIPPWPPPVAWCQATCYHPDRQWEWLQYVPPEVRASFPPCQVTCGRCQKCARARLWMTSEA
eukprot:750639-Pyramimonas_sp.AAC.1